MPDYSWALRGPVLVTQTGETDSSRTYLLVGPDAGQALVLVEVDEVLLINGRETDLGDSYPQWLGLLDEVADLEVGGESRQLPALD